MRTCNGVRRLCAAASKNAIASGVGHARRHFRGGELGAQTLYLSKKRFFVLWQWSLGRHRWGGPA